jgi:hypothetical protein
MAVLQRAGYIQGVAEQNGPSHGLAILIVLFQTAVHRSHIMRKMQADSFATLVRHAGKIQLETVPTTTFYA